MINCGRSEVEQIVRWCIKKWNKSKFVKNEPKIRVYKSCGNTYNIKAEYISDKNTITVYLGAIKDYEELCGIIIHEYWHYLLDPNEFDNIYYDMINRGYNNVNFYNFHPHEILCKQKESKYKIICLDYLKNKLK
ncbi:MAG: hypothetical protein RSE41_03360 [Clostridia bacterium]